MRLEDVTARIRPRGAWESVDLGFALVRRQFGELLLAWCLTVGPLWALLLIASNWIPMGWIVLTIWWLKPFYSRVPLFILSRSLFGAKPTLRETLRAWPRLMFSRFFRIFLTRIPWLVVLPSFAWNRALLLPVLDLEGQRSKGLKQRQAVLLQQAGGASAGLTLMCGLYQLALVFAVLGMGTYLNWNPAEGGGTIEALQDAMVWDTELSRALVWTLIGSYLLTLTVVELFYVGGGFGLYLNCRTSLEGWDVELSFRRLAQRVTKVAALVAVLALFFGAASHAQSLEKPDKKPSTDPDRQKIEEVMSHPDFTIHTETKEVGTGSGGSTMNFSAFAQFAYYFGWFIFWIVVVGLALLLVWVIHKARHLFGGLPNRPAEAPMPRTIMGMDITPESLPADILAAARAAWQAGDPRGALSLLYRGSLLWLVQTARLPIRESDTEGDCLRHSLLVPQPAERDYFGDLTSQWIHVAYATHPPTPEAMERLLSTWPYTRSNHGRAQG